MPEETFGNKILEFLKKYGKMRDIPMLNCGTQAKNYTVPYTKYENIKCTQCTYPKSAFLYYIGIDFLLCFPTTF